MTNEQFATRERKVRIVTPSQFAQGYRRIVLDHRWPDDMNASVPYTAERFVKVRDLEDGNVLVEEPAQ